MNALEGKDCRFPANWFEHIQAIHVAISTQTTLYVNQAATAVLSLIAANQVENHDSEGVRVSR